MSARFEDHDSDIESDRHGDQLITKQEVLELVLHDVFYLSIASLTVFHPFWISSGRRKENKRPYRADHGPALKWVKQGWAKGPAVSDPALC
jgi:hypothetical protein